MRLLFIHNKYKDAGGEDVVFQAETALLSRHKHLVEDLVFDNNEITTTFDKLLSGLQLVYNPTSARMMRKKIEEFKPDLIHVHNFVPLASPSIFFVARKFGIPVVVTLHNYRLICPSATLFHKNKIYEKSIHSLFPIDAILKGVYRSSKLQTAAVVLMTALHTLIGTWRNRVDLYITLTQFARKKFLASAISIPENKLLVKPNFVTDHGRGDEMRKDFFLYVGRLAEEKGIRMLLKATRLASFRLVIIGEGPLRGLVTDFATENPNVSYLGFKDRLTVISHMKKCKGLIFPSLWYEGFPMTILEALSAGTVVITSKLGGMAEIIEDGVNGLHFEAGNVEDLVSKIVEISNNPGYLRSLSDKARSSYLDYYTPEKNYLQLMEIYNRALASSRQPQDSFMYKPVPQGG